MRNTDNFEDNWHFKTDNPDRNFAVLSLHRPMMGQCLAHKDTTEEPAEIKIQINSSPHAYSDKLSVWPSQNLATPRSSAQASILYINQAKLTFAKTYQQKRIGHLALSPSVNLIEEAFHPGQSVPLYFNFLSEELYPVSLYLLC